MARADLIKAGAGIGLIAAAVVVFYCVYEPQNPALPSRAERHAVAGARATIRPRFPSAQEAEAGRTLKYAEEDEALSALLGQRRRWRALPRFITRIYIDGSGRSWFETASDPDDSETPLRESVERCAAGKSKLVRGGSVLLVDRNNRFWVVSQAAPHQLLCFDGKSWTNARLASGETSLPANIPTGQFYRGVFYPSSFEDSSGNLYFIGGAHERTGIGVHRRNPDGNWTFNLLIQPKKPDELFDERPVFTEQAGGRIAIVRQMHERDSSSVDFHVVLFDGKSWRIIEPKGCASTSHSLRSVIPLADGSIGSLCGGDRFWVYWPDGYPSQGQTELDKLVEKLSDAELKEREGASRALVGRGPAIVDALEKIPLDSLPPEGQMRLKFILHTLKAMAGGSEKESALYGGRLVFRECYLVSRPGRGKLKFYVHVCQDLRLKKTYHKVFVTVDSEGNWDVSEIPDEQWAQVGAPSDPQHCFEDSKGGIWLRECLRAGSDNSVAPVAPEGLKYHDVLGEDREGRVYTSMWSHEYLIYDPSAPEDQPEVPHQTLYAWYFQHLAGEPVGFAIESGSKQQSLLAFGSGGSVKTIPRNWNEASVTMAIPLRGEAAIVSLFPWDRDQFLESPFRLWDGAKWTGSDSLADLVHENAARLVQLASTHFDGFGSWYDDDRVRIAGDGRSLWFWSNGDELDRTTQDQKLVNRLEYFDGAQWHDAWSEMGLPTPVNYSRPLCAVSGAHALVIGSHERKAVLLAKFVSGKVTAAALDAIKYSEGVHGGADSFDTTDGRTIVRIGGRTYVLAGDAIEASPELVGLPLGSDTKGNVWFFAGQGRFQIISGSSTLRLNLAPDVVEPCLLAPAPDGRLWLLHALGLSELSLDLSSSAPSLRELHRWAWNAPRNQFEMAYCDASGNLWIRGHASVHARYTLPKAASAP
jgi:hypothetical protein